MRSDAPRHLRYPKCRVLEGLVPLGPMPCEPALEVAVLPMRRWVRRKFLDATMNKYKNDWNKHPGTNGVARFFRD